MEGRICPNCEGARVSPIEYGYGTSRGCSSTVDSPNWECLDCRHEWLDTNDERYKVKNATMLLVIAGKLMPDEAWRLVTWSTEPPVLLSSTKISDGDRLKYHGDDTLPPDLLGQTLERVWTSSRVRGGICGDPKDCTEQCGLQFTRGALETEDSDFYIIRGKDRRLVDVEAARGGALCALVGTVVSACKFTATELAIELDGSILLEFPRYFRKNIKLHDD